MDDDEDEDIDGLLADIDDTDYNETEKDSYRKHINDMIQKDRQLIKNIVKGNFRESILRRTQEDISNDKDYRVCICVIYRRKESI